MSFTSFLKGKSGLNNQVGLLGENIASQHLDALGYHLLTRGHSLKVGEIDIVCEKDGRIYFFEVKTSKNVHILPQDNMTKSKIDNLKRSSLTYIKNRYPGRDDIKYSIGFVGVRLNDDNSLKNIKIIENIF